MATVEQLLRKDSKKLNLAELTEKVRQLEKVNEENKSAFQFLCLAVVFRALLSAIRARNLENLNECFRKVEALSNALQEKEGLQAIVTAIDRELAKAQQAQQERARGANPGLFTQQSPSLTQPINTPLIDKMVDILKPQNTMLQPKQNEAPERTKIKFLIKKLCDKSQFPVSSFQTTWYWREKGRTRDG